MVFGSEPADLFFLEDNRPTAMEIVRLSFRFGKAVAAIESLWIIFMAIVFGRDNYFESKLAIDTVIRLA